MHGLTTDAGGGFRSRQWYYPYGETRWSDGTLPTDYQFTGQRAEDFGLYDYHARYYDGAIGRFISADTIVPSPGNPQDFNRYSYVRNSPLKYVDPTGHCAQDDDACWILLNDIENQFGIDVDTENIGQEIGASVTKEWTVAELEALQLGLSQLVKRWGQTTFNYFYKAAKYRRVNYALNDEPDIIAHWSSSDKRFGFPDGEGGSVIEFYDMWGGLVEGETIDWASSQDPTWHVIHESWHEFDRSFAELFWGRDDGVNSVWQGRFNWESSSSGLWSIPDPPTAYARNSPAEAFAEIGASYVFDPSRLSSQYLDGVQGVTFWALAVNAHYP